MRHWSLTNYPLLAVQYFPSWFPGTHYANMARKWRPEAEKFLSIPFESVLQKMV